VQSDLSTASITHSSNFELYASIPRTANAGLSTIWVDGDDLNVFHAVAGSNEYINDNKFTLANATTGLFKGNLGDKSGLSSELAYDWYVCYPYNSALDKPGYGGSYDIGNTKNDGRQTQIGNNSTAHLSGEYLPLVGVAKGVAANEAPTLALKHVASYAKFIVKNTLNEPITVTEISLSVPGQQIAGGFYIDFTDIENISYVAKSNETAESTTLSVSGGSPIAPNDQAEFYLAVAPFTKEVGSEATITITATNGNGLVGKCVKDASSAAMTFTAGKYKEVAINYQATFESLATKMVEITADDFKNIGVKYGYNDTVVHTINAADGSVWTAYQAYRASATSSSIGVKKDKPEGYLATPIVSGAITQIVMNIKSTGENTKFALAHSGNDLFYTSDALGKGTQDWSVDITNGCKQIFIHSAYGTVTINSVTVYYQ
jgi:hypothetical protein